MESVIEFIFNLFIGNGVIIAAAAFVVGQVIKGFKNVPNNLIPLIGGLLGIILGIFIPGLFENQDIITSGILGMLLGWGATGGYETIKQLKQQK